VLVDFAKDFTEPTRDEILLEFPFCGQGYANNRFKRALSWISSARECFEEGYPAHTELVAIADAFLSRTGNTKNLLVFFHCYFSNPD